MSIAEAPEGPTGAEFTPVVHMDRPTKETFREQLAFLHGYANIRTDRYGEILDQIGAITPFQASIAFLRADTKPKTHELLEVVFRLARHVEHQFKHALACRRPVELSAQVQPIIETPGHGTLPSGHSTEAFMAAFVLWELLKDAHLDPYGEESYGIQFMKLANRIAVNRTVAGVHFPLDSAAGATLGLTLGAYFVGRAKGGVGSYTPAHFDGRATVPAEDTSIGHRDFHWTMAFDVKAGRIREDEDAHPSIKLLKDRVNLEGQGSEILHWLWDEARKEWT